MALDLLTKLKSGLEKTRALLLDNIRALAASKTKIDEELLGQLEETLLRGDVGVETSQLILRNIRGRVREERFESTDHLLAMLKDEMAKLFHGDFSDDEIRQAIPDSPRPYVIMVVGVNGVGKTTTIGKLALLLKQAGNRVVIGAADTFRAAANEQLEIWAQRAQVELIQQLRGADPASVAFDTISSAVSRKADVVIVDTAGRLHTKSNLMEELKKIKRVMERRLAGAPHEVLLVLDAGTGQNGIQQAKHFSAAVGVTGLIVTKLDGTAKGGVVIAVSNELKIPVRYVGIGEKIEDLQPFDRWVFLDALFENSEVSA